MLVVNKKSIRKGKSHHTPSKNNIILLPKPELKLNQSTKKNEKVIDFIKQKNRFIIESAFDLKGTREFLASKEVAMRVIKLNDEIIEDKKNNEDSDIKNIYNTNLGDNIDELRKKVSKKISAIPLKSKFKSNKELFLDTDLKKFKRELKKIKEKLNSKDPKDNSSLKSKIKSKKSKKTKKESSENQTSLISPKKKSNDNLAIINLTSKKKDSSIGFSKQKQTQSQFLFSEINKKLMAGDEINLSGISSSNNNSPQYKSKNKLKEDIYSTEINNFNIFNEKIKNKINEGIIEEDKSEKNDNENLKFQINSDKESLISILSDLM